MSQQLPSPRRHFTVGELKFREMVSDLMTMTEPRVVINCPRSSKARSLRRSFYTWTKGLAQMERNFMEKLEYKVVGRQIIVCPKADWQPVEASGELPNVSASQGEPAGDSGLNDRS